MLRFSSASVLRWCLASLPLLLASCVDSYLPDVANAPTSYLVVDGAINGNGVTRIKLSRSVNVSSSAVPAVEKGAKIAIVDNTGLRYNLTERTAGFYLSDSLQLNPSRQYQLRFTTSTNIAYASDLVPLKVTPPIDKLGFRVANDQVQLLVDTHDATGQSRFFRWRFTETWEFHSAFESFLEYDSVSQTLSSRFHHYYTCWRTEQASSVRQGSTTQLSQPALTDFAILNYSNKAERFAIRYSALVSQYAETAEEYNYYELLRKNTEAVGGVNDPLPVQLTGNVHRLDNASEPVLGYVGAHTVQQKRMFINRQDLPLPATWVFDSAYPTCSLGIELFNPPTGKPIAYPYTRDYNTRDHIPVDFYYDNGRLLGYVGSTRECVDCRARGSLTKPSFW